jgi:large subunit ribosomal protein L21e
MFKRGFKEAGQIRISTFLKVYRVGDIVDIKANGAQQKGMPHKYYHGYARSIFIMCGQGMEG